MTSSLWGHFTFTHDGNRWVIKKANRFELGDTRSRGLLSANTVAAWCRDSTTWPTMQRVYEDLVGPMLRPPTSDTIDHAIRVISSALERGDLVAMDARDERPSRPIGEGTYVKKKEPEPPPPPRKRVEPPKTLFSFAIRFVDEIGSGIEDIDLSFSHGGAKDDGTTDGNGVARLEDSKVRTATAKVADAKGLRKAVKARWDQPRSGERKWLDESQGVTVVRLVKGAAPSFDLVADKLRIISIQPVRPRVRLVGMFFDTDKTFLLPSTTRGIRGIRRQYELHPDSSLLIVGHTDTSGREKHNATLSLERADSVAAYLTDDSAAWEKVFRDDPARASLTWGTREIQLMLSALPEGETPFLSPDDVDGKDGPETEGAVRQFQQAKGLKVDGIYGPETRQALIKAYMALDDTTLPAGIKITTHGCGENFPVADTVDGERSEEDRRIDAFFFDGAISPAPPGKTSKRGSTEYPTWLAQVTETQDFTTSVEEDLIQVVIRLLDGDSKPRANVDYVLSAGKDQFVGRTKADGVIDHFVLKSATAGSLEFDGQTIPLELQELSPLPSLLGVQQRLNNLHYAAGAEDGNLSEESRGALRAFQGDAGIPQTGEADEATVASLRSAYGH